jgi:hypothetical protein
LKSPDVRTSTPGFERFQDDLAQRRRHRTPADLKRSTHLHAGNR